MVKTAKKLLASDASYETLIKKLDAELQEVWQEWLEEGLRYQPNKESFLRFLQEQVIDYVERDITEIQLRPQAREYLLGYAVLPGNDHDRLLRYETALDRKFEKTLAMLIKLQDIRKQSVWQI